MIPAGRRSGKTELSKRKLVSTAIACTIPEGGRFVASAPTNDQAIRLYWDDLKRLTPPECMAREPRESTHEILLKNGATIFVTGLDKAQRLEGSPVDGILIDEFSDVKSKVWQLNIRPALDTDGRPGWAWLLGVPEGVGHYSEMYYKAKRGELQDWDAFHWISADILSPEVIETAKRDLDELTYQQEYEGSFVNFSGRAYYKFDQAKHVQELRHNPDLPLITCWDFNTAPGTMSVWQEQPTNSWTGNYQPTVSCCLGEVYVPRSSNTELVATRFVNDWVNRHTRGEVHLYGDASGGNKTSNATTGSDWDIVERVVKNAFGAGRVRKFVKPANPTVRGRINSVNSKACPANGKIGIAIDPRKAPNTLKDFENTTTIEGGSGELDKDKDNGLWTHLTDGYGYYCEFRFPTVPANRSEQTS